VALSPCLGLDSRHSYSVRLSIRFSSHDCSCPLAPRKSFDILALYKSDYYYYYYLLLFPNSPHPCFFIPFPFFVFSLSVTFHTPVNLASNPRSRVSSRSHYEQIPCENVISGPPNGPVLFCSLASVSVNFRQKPAVCENGAEQIELSFLAQRFSSVYHTLCSKEIWVSPKITVLPSRTFTQTLDLKNFATARRSSHVMST